jgi:hypothetical protein
MTPEARVKKKIRELLDSYGDKLYYYMPVPGGYGRTTIDYLICARGIFVGIEAKGRPGQGPTERQEGVIEDIRAAGGTVFVINDDGSLGALRIWLESAMKL